jgi:large conductance mechanosensitive channel
MLKEFKAFLLRGNLIEIATAFILAVAFAAVVASFTTDIVGGILGAIFGKPDFSSVVITIGKGTIGIGNFITVTINFVIVAFVMFLVLKAYNRMRPPAEAGPTEAELLTEIRDALRQR